MNRNVILTACLSFPVVSATAPAQQPHDAQPVVLDARACAGLAQVGMADALAAALQAAPGAAVKVELEGTRTGTARSVVYEVMVVTRAGKLHEVIVDAVSGEVAAAGAAEEDDVAELPRYVAALRRSPRKLQSLVRLATRSALAVPVVASLEEHEGGVACSVTMVREGRNQVVVLDASNGAVLHVGSQILVGSRHDEEEERPLGAESKSPGREEHAEIRKSGKAEPGEEEEEEERESGAKAGHGAKTKSGAKPAKAKRNGESEEEEEGEHGEKSEHARKGEANEKAGKARNGRKAEQAEEEEEEEHAGGAKAEHGAKAKAGKKPAKGKRNGKSEEEEEEGGHGEKRERAEKPEANEKGGRVG